jgi:hypothetical protein
MKLAQVKRGETAVGLEQELAIPLQKTDGAGLKAEELEDFGKDALQSVLEVGKGEDDMVQLQETLQEPGPAVLGPFFPPESGGAGHDPTANPFGRLRVILVRGGQWFGDSVACFEV